MGIVKPPELPFFDYVDEAFKIQKVPEVFEIKAYLAFLLCGFLRQNDAAVLNSPLLLELWKSSQDVSNKNLSRIRLIADASLFTAGVVAPYMRRSIGPRHYVRVGESAYEILFLYGEDKEFSTVYELFYRDLRPYAQVLSYVARHHLFDIVESVLSVYERYLATGGSEEDRKFLRDHGVSIPPARL